MWFESFRKRYCIEFKALSGESATINKPSVENWKNRICYSRWCVNCHMSLYIFRTRIQNQEVLQYKIVNFGAIYIHLAAKDNAYKKI